MKHDLFGQKKSNLSAAFRSTCIQFYFRASFYINTVLQIEEFKASFFLSAVMLAGNGSSKLRKATQCNKNKLNLVAGGTFNPPTFKINHFLTIFAISLGDF